MLTAIFWCRKGATAIEYALVASIISVAALAGIMGIGTKVGIMFNNVSTHLPG
jgi:pilus assembly protein Flp/PilA